MATPLDWYFQNLQSAAGPIGSALPNTNIPSGMVGSLSLVPLGDEGYRQWQNAQQAAQQARQAATQTQRRLQLRGGSPTTGIEMQKPILQDQTMGIQSPRWSTNPPLPGTMPSGQLELPSIQGGPTSKAPIPFDMKSSPQTTFKLEPKGLPLPNEIPYVTPKQTGLSIAPENVIDYRSQRTQRPFVNISSPLTPKKMIALKQQAEAMAAKLGISPQEAMQRMTSLSLEPIEGSATTGQQTIRTDQSGAIPRRQLASPGAIGAGLSVLPVLGQFLYNQRQMQDAIGADEAAKQLIQRNIASIIRPTGIDELDRAIQNVTGSTTESGRPIRWVGKEIADVPVFPGSESSAIPLPAAETGGALSYLGDEGRVTKFKLQPTETEGVLSYLGNEASRNELNKRSQSAQVGSDYYSGRLNAMDAVKQGGGYLADVQPVGVKEGQTVRYVGPTTIQARAQEPVTDFLPSVIGSTKDKKGNVVPVFGKTLLSDGNMQFGSVAEKPSTTQGFKYEVYGPKGLQGTATLPSGFMGVEKPKGGGTLSYVGGRTPEEQKAINERVASINSQTAAMRDLRNAQRLEQGLPTVEQEQQANSMNAMLERLAPTPNLSALDDAQAQLMQELKDASQLRGFGSRRMRDDRMKAAQIGLAQIAATREGALRDYAAQRNSVLATMQNQQALAAKQAESERAARQWAAEQGLEWNKLDVQTQRNIADAYDQAVARDIAQKNLALNEARLARGTPGNVTVNDIKQYYNPSLPGKPEEINQKKLLDVEGIGEAPTTGFVIGKPYLNPTTGKTYVFTNENGDRKEIGLREAIIMNRELQRNR